MINSSNNNNFQVIFMNIEKGEYWKERGKKCGHVNVNCIS